MHRILATLILTLLGWNGFAQSKDDIISVIKAISEVPELDPLFQVELSEGPTMVLLRNERLNSGNNEAQRNYHLVTQDDLWGIAKPVKILTYQEADLEGIRREMIVNFDVSFSGDQCNARFSCILQEGNRYLEGWVSLNRPGFLWEVTGHNVRIR